MHLDLYLCRKGEKRRPLADGSGLGHSLRGTRLHPFCAAAALYSDGTRKG